jgi:hypothetical protein
MSTAVNNTSEAREFTVRWIANNIHRNSDI